MANLDTLRTIFLIISPPTLENHKSPIIHIIKKAYLYLDKSTEKSWACNITTLSNIDKVW